MVRLHRFTRADSVLSFWGSGALACSQLRTSLLTRQLYGDVERFDEGDAKSRSQNLQTLLPRLPW